MRAPDFWYRPAGMAAHLLTPLGWLYDAVGVVRRAVIRPTGVGVPVVCIGNLVAGGAGKTPVALAIASLLRERQPHFLTRGYGGSLAGPVRVDPARHTAGQVGDEALLLAAAAPTWLARDRVAGARAATAAGARIIVMDDGFQNPHLRQDLALVVIDGAVGFGNGRRIPAGPLRELPARALRRAQGIVMIGDDRYRLAPRLSAALPCFDARLVTTAAAAALSGRRVVAFAGIGRPQKFFDTLAELGCIVVAQHAFADHHPYAAAEIAALVAAADAHDAVAVTTAKDAARLTPAQRARLHVVDIAVEWADAAGLRRFLESAI